MPAQRIEPIDGSSSTPFHASTGADAYDRLAFSSRVCAEAASDPSGALTVIWHHGMAGVRDGQVCGSADLSDMVLVEAGEKAGPGLIALRFEPCESEEGRAGRAPVHFIAAGRSFAATFPAAQPLMFFAFKKDRLRGALTDLADAIEAPAPAPRDPRLRTLCMALAEEVRAPGTASRLFIDSVTAAIAVALWASAASPPSDERVVLTNAKRKRLEDYIEAHLHEDIGLECLAGVAGLSPTHLCRVFKISTGQSPYKFVTSRRIARAKSLLADINLPLAELALACGFSSQAHFTVAFAKSVGLSPGKYRRQMMI